MRCKRFGKLLAGYLDNELTTEEKMAVENHLTICPNCREELEGLALVQRDLSEALRLRSEEVSPSARVWEKVRDNISKDSHSTFWDWIGGAFRNPVWRTVTPVTLVLVALISLWGSGIITFNNSGSQSSDKNNTLASRNNIEIFGLSTNPAEQDTRGVGSSSFPTAVNGSTATETTGFGSASSPPKILSENVTFSLSGTEWNTADAYTDPQQLITLNINEPFIIALNISSGQKWIVSPNPNVELIQVFIKDRNPSEAEYDGVQYFCFKALTNGSTNLEFRSSSEENGSNIP